MAWVSTLLIITGVLLPAVGAMAEKPDGSWTVTSSGPTYTGANTQWTYTVSPVGRPQDISHVDLAVCWAPGAIAIESSPDYSNHPWGADGAIPGAGNVLKFDGSQTTITVTYAGHWVTGSQTWYVKAGTSLWSGSVAGPSCVAEQADFEVSKTVSATNDSNTGASSLTLTGGGTAYYFYTIHNTGNVPLEVASATDDVLGTLSFSPTMISPGQSATASASKVFPALAPGSPDQTETNTFTASVVFDSQTYGPKSAQATVVNRAPQAPPAHADLSVTKTVSAVPDPTTGQPSVTLPNGGTAYYFYTVTNTGNVPIQLSGTDDKLGTIAFTPSSLAPGAIATGTATASFPAPAPGAADQTVQNTVTVTGTAGQTSVQKTAQASVTITAPAVVENFTLTKKVNTENNPVTALPWAVLEGGGQVWYFYTVTNTGNIPLVITSAVDDKLGNLTFIPSTVPVGGTATAVMTKTFPAPGTNDPEFTETNHVTVTAGRSQITREAEATIHSFPARVTDFTLTKQVSTSDDASTGQSMVTLTGGGRVYYFYTITNTGNMPLDIDGAEDDILGDVTFDKVSLDPGESAHATLTKDFAPPNATETETNTITVTLYNDGTPVGPKTAMATVVNNPVPRPAPLTFAVTKTVSLSTNPATGQPILTLTGAGTVHYFYSVTNTSTREFRISSAVDDVLGPVTFAPQSLAPGETATATLTKAFPGLAPGSNPVNEVNTLSVTVTDGSETAGPLTATATVIRHAPAAHPGFTVTKTVSTSSDPATGAASVSLTGGGTVWYFYTLTNTGDVPLTIAQATDDILGPVGFTPGVVPVGGTATATLSKNFALRPHGSPDLQEINTVTVTAGFGDQNQTQTARATVVVHAAPPPPPPAVSAFTLTKSVALENDPAKGQSSVSLTGGGTVWYFYTIRNTGDTTLSITQATDDRLGTLSFSPAVIPPGGTATATASKTFAALPAGTAAQTETNVALVRMADGLMQTAQATVVNNPEPARPDFRITKLVSDVNDPATGRSSVTLVGGGTVWYFYTVTNTGNVPLTITSATDDKLGAIGFPAGAIPPGGTATATKSKAFPAVTNGQTETNTVTVRASYGGQIVRTLTASAAVTNTARPVGSVEVIVLDGSPRNHGAQLPIAGAQVDLGGGLTGTTDQNGRISFDQLPFATYQATATAGDPKHGGADVQSGTGSTAISEASRNGTITIVLTWRSPAPTLAVTVCEAFPQVGGIVTAQGPDGAMLQATAPDGDGKYHFSGLTAGTWTLSLSAPGLKNPASATLTVKDDETVAGNAYTADLSASCPATTGNLAGRICAPKAPGAELSGEGPNGATASTSIAATGKLGEWRSWVLNSLRAGSWKLTLKSPGKPDTSKTVTVVPGETVQVSDFSTVCTGGQAASQWPTLLLGGLLIAAGLALRWAIWRPRKA
jgi:hypothetical protein